MDKYGLNQLRSMFLAFYKSKDHYERKSFSLVPEKDKSLLLINSGMAPLKPFFAGVETPPSKRMTTCQKCIRTGDIENVGYTARHATFFEMLGSFSFGDYFKKESIAWGWEFIIDVLKMPKDKIWASVYEKDDEAYDLWKNMIGMPAERIVRLGKDDNFWEIGVGPCGPCSELYFDRGEKYGCGNPECKPGCDCDRFVEFWNHVFTQYNRDEAGNYSPLPNPNIDTGMGLERLACIMQEVESIFEIDTIKYILDSVVGLSTVDYKFGSQPTDVSVRLITDHIRSVTFLICDGVLPSNEGRGYVLRRLLRRAARHGKLIGIKGDFLAGLSEKVIDASKEAYPELEEKKAYIRKILTIEEQKFSETIDLGMHILDEFIKDLKENEIGVLSGEKAFKLYDTFGFPVELTLEILQENKFELDLMAFNQHMSHQKDMARSARKSSSDTGWAGDGIDYDKFGSTEFTGYTTLEENCTIVGIIKNNQKIQQANSGDRVKLIFNKTPFYAESGGQISDTGIIFFDDIKLDLLSCEKVKDVILHEVLLKTDITIGMNVQSAVNIKDRNSSARNHTATHLLHKALRDVVGLHIDQAGSLVTPEKLRFDFTHFESISKEDLTEIENIVNEKIIAFLTVKTEETDIASAIKNGATALFGEKYKDSVRVISIGDYSMELCGGTHVTNSGQIGSLRIVSESGVAAGVRRIEAITGLELNRVLVSTEEVLLKASELLKVQPGNMISKISATIEEFRLCKKELEGLKKESLADSVGEFINNATVKNGIKIITQKFEGLDINDLRNLSDEIKASCKAVIIVLASIQLNKVTYIVSVSDDLLDKGYHAGNMIKQIAISAGGSGGGKADLAQAGAKEVSLIDNAFETARMLI